MSLAWARMGILILAMFVMVMMSMVVVIFVIVVMMRDHARAYSPASCVRRAVRQNIQNAVLIMITAEINWSHGSAD